VASAGSFPRRMRLPVLVVGLGVAVVAAGYLGARWHGVDAVADESSLVRVPAPSIASDPPARATQPAALGPAHSVASVAPVVDRTPQHGSAFDPSPATTKPAPAKPAASRGPAKATRPEAAAPATAIADAGSAIEPVPTVSVPAPPPPVQEAPPDRWQLLAEALAQCEKEVFVANVICVQRARWRYCDGYWGTVAQCPGAMNSNYER